MKTKSQPSDFRQILESISRKHDTRKVFEAFVRFAACALAAQTRETEYLEEVKHWERQDLDLFGKALGALVLEMEGRPFEDVLGGYYMEFALSHKGQQWNGEFHTPKPICDLMAQMTLGDVESLPKDRPITVCEPACGAGAMILSLGEACLPEVRRRLRVTAIDVSRTACDMTFVNTTLWGIPTRVIHGNPLSLECWAAWSNIHWIMPWLSLVPMHPVSAMMPPGPPTSARENRPRQLRWSASQFHFVSRNSRSELDLSTTSLNREGGCFLGGTSPPQFPLTVKMPSALSVRVTQPKATCLRRWTAEKELHEK